MEDDASIMGMASQMLAQLGYTVLAANTPEKAIQLAHSNTGAIHLLLTDVVMPEMNGRELADRLLVLQPDLVIVFMSGYTADIIAHQGVLNNSINFIQKPFSRQDLAAHVRNALDA